MKGRLLIVESPTKARTLSKYLRGFEIEATLGHIKDLPKNTLGVDTDHNFKPIYIIIPGKEKVVKRLKKVAQKSKEIYLGPDPDREGEAIAWHVAEELNGKKAIKRVLFHEITPKAIREAIQSPTELNENRFNSQQARRILDRLVGYKISPLLWEKVKRGLSAGRVQSVALRLVCERERAIQKFCPREYWEIIVKLGGQTPPAFEAKLIQSHGKKINIPTEEQAHKIVGALKGKPFLVSKVTFDRKKRYPPPAFTTSRLQQEAARSLKFTAQKTMLIAQQLYEGIPLGKQGHIGLITYMRTDSVRVARFAIDEARKFINAHFGRDYLPKTPHIYKNKKHVQDAHEAIRPTSVYRTPEAVAPYVNKSQYALYELIWKRFLGSQMSPAIYDQTTIDISAGKYLFQAKGSVLVWPGFKHLYKEREELVSLPPLKETEVLKVKEIVPEQHFTKPPARYSEATLIRELEEKGIGRPSTYAVIISTILERNYAGREKGQFKPTELGFLVTDLLVENFPDIMDVSFTAHLEDELDEIEEGKVRWVETLRKFHKVFKANLKKAQENMATIKSSGLPTEVICGRCGHPMVIKWGRHGHFLACSNYPHCNNTKEFSRDEKGNIVIIDDEINEVCPECERPLVLRRGRYGPFLACSGYPECHFTRKIEEKVERQSGDCPVCGKPLVVRKNKRGIRFIACSNYPNCRYTASFKTNR